MNAHVRNTASDTLVYLTSPLYNSSEHTKGLTDTTGNSNNFIIVEYTLLV